MLFFSETKPKTFLPNFRYAYYYYNIIILLLSYRNWITSDGFMKNRILPDDAVPAALRGTDASNTFR